ncbi:MAG: polymer-forming cytoskeletal protein [Zoogloeaceae bacterium]|nr:polymer-forming cytoskeletal protein [Zoogloeaceae bacterium]
MFGKRKKGGIEVAKLSSLIADNLHIVGDVHFSGGLRIDGRVEGNVFCKQGTKGLLVLSEKGFITGKVHTYDAVINGNITGDLEVEHFAELQVSANVVGNVRYRQLQMDCGATVEGKLVRIHEDASERTAARVEASPVAARPASAPPASAAVDSRPAIPQRASSPVPPPRVEVAPALAGLEQDRITASR